ncbi:MAG: hypothetical protein EU547_04355, partial [Promethearchaeota archaeon]
MKHLSNLHQLDPTTGIGSGLVTEASMFLASLIDPSNPSDHRLRMFAGRSDMFSLIFDPETNTLEIY